ncbi:MAG: hypothetical protein NBV68_17990 [Erythrobacter sp.]|uniref:hypothetical protein n=1 Tax=Erythrobacter sp. TaxID=1042 RepID=UPI0025F53706|nr:hypothetical protein [Erythrobacter sp.]MCM0001267.1 hypothetical protein [Erythrobacter sp.]
MTSRFLLLALALFMAPQTVLAQSSTFKQAEERFKVADKNADGKLSRDEAKAGMPRIHANFDRIDADKSGFVTLAEIKAALTAAGR